MAQFLGYKVVPGLFLALSYPKNGPIKEFGKENVKTMKIKHKLHV